MKPGESVASPSSMTCAPCGIGRLLPASTILSPWTMTTPFVTSAFDFPSKRRAALRAIVAGVGSAANEATAESTAAAEQRRRNFFMASDMKFEARKQGATNSHNCSGRRSVAVQNAAADHAVVRRQSGVATTTEAAASIWLFRFLSIRETPMVNIG